ncbi:hypothetical protein [Micromonospora sp. KC723]|uniref:hypothetical protein n=1 Tax=Micromonospora sp. KC723 TaxID=2530381 RepID=UPI0010443F2F|nr:hypothetical protein [Micromonospora sp. KC723]TDB77141.1 hypothetical protein E1165_04420 [Micromonospora sp. KC723]
MLDVAGLRPSTSRRTVAAGDRVVLGRVPLPLVPLLVGHHFFHTMHTASRETRQAWLEGITSGVAHRDWDIEGKGLIEEPEGME